VTGIERTLKALNFEEVDRIPVAGGLVGHAEFLAEVAGAPDFWTAPRQIAFEAYRRLRCDAILGPVLPKHPDTTTRDAAGRPTWFTNEIHTPRFTTPEQVAEHARTFPTPLEVRRRFDFQKTYDGYVELMKSGQGESGEMLFIPHCLGYAPHFPTGTEEFDHAAFLMACALYPESVERMFQVWGEQSRLTFEAVAKATSDHNLLRLIWIGTDLCDRNGPVLSPALLERLYFPVLARAIAPLKEAGMKVVWHADANYKRILAEMIDLGIDGFQGFYEEEGGMELAGLAQMKAKTGLPLILFGSISTVRVLPRADVVGVRREVARCIHAAAGRGGLLLAPSSSIGPDVPKANIRAMFEFARSASPICTVRAVGTV